MINNLQNEIFYFFPNIIRENIYSDNFIVNNAEEIRIRVGQPICIRGCCFEKFLTYRITTDDILKILENFCNNSIYSFQNEINSGFITIRGGHRVGITGTCVFENGKIKNIKYDRNSDYR